MNDIKTIYLDHQASTPIKEAVLQEMLPFWREQHGNPHSSEHAVGWAAHKSLTAARKKVASFLGCYDYEVIFTSGATEANNIAIKGLCGLKAERKGRSRILVSAIEHKCVLKSATYVAETLGYELNIIPVNSDGKINVEAFEKMLGTDVQLVSIGYVNNEIGTIQDIETISKLCNKTDTYLHSDCAQAASFLNLSKIAELTDSVSISGHKFGGPMGVGGLYIKRNHITTIEPLFHGGGQESNIRSGTAALPLCIGLGKACELNTAETREINNEHIAKLRDRFVQILETSKHNINLNGCLLDQRHPSNANLQFSNLDAQDILLRLQPNVAASSGSACTSGITEPSHVLTSIGLSEDDANSSIRFSFGSETTSEDIDLATDLILNILDNIEE